MEMMSFETESLGNEYVDQIVARDGTARYRVRGFVNNDTDEPLELEVMGNPRPVVVPANTKVYSPWSSPQSVNLDQSTGLVPDRTTTPMDPMEMDVRPPAAEFVADLADMAGMNPDAIDSIITVVSILLAVAIGGMMVYLTGNSVVSIITGGAIGAFVFGIGGTFVMGIPWYVAWFPISLFAGLAIYFFARRG